MAATLKGQQVKISFGSLSYSGYIPEDFTWSKPNKSVEDVKDADGATIAKIFMDPSTEVEGTFIIDSTGSITPPADGTQITITLPDNTSFTGLSIGSSVKFAHGATKLTLKLIKEDNLTLS